VWIIGGARIYEQFLVMHKNDEIAIDEMCITTMEGTHTCDTFFPMSMIGTTYSTTTTTYSTTNESNASFLK
jgi:dihydrofolate reductase